MIIQHPLNRGPAPALREAKSADPSDARATMKSVLRHIWRRAHAADARFTDVIALILITADWQQVVSSEVQQAEEILVFIGEHLDQQGLTPASASREAVQAAVKAANPGELISPAFLHDLADLIVLAALSNAGGVQ